jgi:hypothetical protein
VLACGIDIDLTCLTNSPSINVREFKSATSALILPRHLHGTLFITLDDWFVAGRTALVASVN